MIANYSITAKIYESANSLVYRGCFKENNQPIILKILKQNYPTPSELNRYKQEYKITRSFNTNIIVKAYDLQRYENTLMMVLEDFGGESLKKLISQNPLNLEQFLNIAIKTTESLDKIHTANIIHKDINPSNIVYNPHTEELKIIDFGISTNLSQEFLHICPPSQLEGTLVYIAPEQTGRMNRGIDYRSDFYSLGITFYELLTQQVPFESNDTMELVHCHLAQQPLPVQKINSDIPLVISNIIDKLLAKTPEERYQSVKGIKADLEKCLHQLKTVGEISTFPLATQDIIEKFQIPQKLYGREKEISLLLKAFEEVSQGTVEMVTVSGYSGIGKSALVNEIHKPITEKRGEFISGKFDQLQRDIPYSAISQAFQCLMRQLLSESEQTLQTWKNKILEALGNNGQIIIDVIPELEKIIGKQPKVEELGATESQNRFHLFFTRFINIFCAEKHPLVIFIDDLQWADLPSLQLIEQLISDIDNKYLLIIGAYRDNEITAIHPLVNTLEKINQSQVTIKQITLSPLDINNINQLTADTLKCSLPVSKSLAQLVASKTYGNPFFLTQLLYSLYQNNLLRFNAQISLSKQQSCWQWNIEEIKAVSITDNVVELMVAKIEKLKKTTQEVLKLAACIGNSFNLEILTLVNNKSQADTAKQLQSALDEGLVIPLNNKYKIPLLKEIESLLDNHSAHSTYIPYKFLHDRVQQAAYSLIPEEEKKQVHLQIGRLLLQNSPQDKLEQIIFDIVNQLNEGIPLINNQSEKNQLAKLNLQAGKKAKASTAYQSALRYLEIGSQLLNKNSWKNHYKLTLELHIETLEALYLNNQWEKIEKHSTIIRENVDHILDKVKVYELMILSYYAQFQPEKAIDIAIGVLDKLGIQISKNVINSSEIHNRIKQAHESLNLLLKEKNIDNLADLPVMTDPYKLAAISILQPVMTATWTTNFPLFIEIVLTQLNLCINYNNPPQAAATYACYGMLLCGVIRDLDGGYQFGKLSLTLLEKYDIPKLEILVLYLYYAFIWPWKKFINDKVAQTEILNSLQRAINTGSNEYACYISLTYCFIKFFGGGNLENLEEDYDKYTKLITKFEQEYSINLVEISSSIVVNLIHAKIDKYFLFIGNSPEEEAKRIEEYISVNNQWLLFFYYFGKTVVSYVLKDFSQAVKISNQAEKYVLAVSGGALFSLQHSFYFSLAHLAYYHNYEMDEQKELLKQIEKNQDNIKEWAKFCPENVQNKYDLIEAEKARVLGQYLRAEEYYEKAIQGAKKSEFIHEEALAYERAAEFYLALEREEIGQFYLRNAHHCYSRWGAKVKVQQLEKEYPQHLVTASKKSISSRLTASISTTGNDGDILDLSTVIKASHAISGEIKLDKLLQNLMKITIENAGAQKGYLILKDQGDWVIEAQGTTENKSINVLQSIPIKSINPNNSLPILPTKVINYVARTKESLVLKDASNAEQFMSDRYIAVTQCKSILCMPLLNQGQLKGILYLENNLTTGAFTSERIELLNILSTQAAISIDNSRLYQTLEQRVEERTRELSQTLNVLQATQAELIFENDLLKNPDQSSSINYQVGGSLSVDAPSYVVRTADRELYKALKQGEFCYILNARQMGKSSLMVRMMNHLNYEGYKCVAIDLTRLGSDHVTIEQWYKGLAMDLLRNFGLRKKVNFKTWWNERLDISPVQRLSEFIEDILLVEVNSEREDSPAKLVIFIDELDSILGLPFPLNDFFALIRSCYNQRSIHSESRYKDLTFAFFGVATPSELVNDTKRTPFNIGQGIKVESFKIHEAQPLLSGLKDKISNPQTMLQEILHWTGGQPFLTQKLCRFIRESEIAIPLNGEAQWLANLVQEKIITDWESKDQPEHLKTISDRILKSENKQRLVNLYQKILKQGQIIDDNSSLVKELILSGIIISKNSYLQPHNRIYQTIFDLNWTTKIIGNLS